jgi:lipopolysaccharide transport system permease protein
MVRDVWLTREVMWRLFARDFMVQFRQKMLGYLWVFLNPLIGAAGFIFLNYAGILHTGDMAIPYPLYLFFGVMLWGLFTGSIGAVSGGLTVHADLVVRTNVPRIALALSGLAGVVYLLLVNIVILVFLCAIIGVPPSRWALTLPLMVLPLMALGVGIGLVLAVVGVLARDVTTVVNTVLNLMMYLSPVVYVPIFDNRLLQRVIDWNPLTYLIHDPRGLFFTGILDTPVAFALSAVIGFSTLVCGIHAFYMIQDQVAERL